jgi:hypothetical protein
MAKIDEKSENQNRKKTENRENRSGTVAFTFILTALAH